MTEHSFPHLSQFLSAYFHQDWHLDTNSADEVIQDYLENEPPITIQQTSQELDSLLQQNLDNSTLSTLLTDDLGCYYNPEFQSMTPQQWLTWLQSQFHSKQA